MVQVGHSFSEDYLCRLKWINALIHGFKVNTYCRGMMLSMCQVTKRLEALIILLSSVLLPASHSWSLLQICTIIIHAQTDAAAICRLAA